MSDEETSYDLHMRANHRQFRTHIKASLAVRMRWAWQRLVRKVRRWRKS